MALREEKTLIISGQDVQEVVSHVGVDALMDRLLQNLQARINSIDDRVQIPVRAGFHYEKPNSGLIEWMPIYKEGENVLLKVVGYHPSNSSLFDLPTIVSTISAYNTKTGHLTTIMDGALLTALRTGAASAIASKILAHPDSSVLGLIGCGAQAVTQLHAISREFQIEKVLISDIDHETEFSFEKRCSVLDLNVGFEVLGINEVVENSDILCTATSIDVGAGPLFTDVETKPHLHINAVGSDFPGKMEIPLGFLKKSFVCPDFLEQALLEGECQQLDSQEIGADLEKLVKNSDSYESIQIRRSLFDSTGWAFEDQVAMELLLAFAIELDLGHEVEIENVPNDAKNPYDFYSDEVIRLDVEEKDISKASKIGV